MYQNKNILNENKNYKMINMKVSNHNIYTHMYIHTYAYIYAKNDEISPGMACIHSLNDRMF